MFLRLLASLRVLATTTALVAAGVLLAPQSAVRAQPATEADQADTIERARTEPPVRAGVWIRGVLASGQDRDWFRLRIDSGGTVLITLGHLPADYRLTLAAADGRVLAVSDRLGTTFEQLQRRLPAGRYFVGVTSPRGESSAQSYRLLVRRVPSGIAVLDSHPVAGNMLYGIAGQVLNNTGSWQRYPRVTVRFYGAGGRYLGQSTALTAQTYLGPRQRGHFQVIPDRPEGAVRYRLVARAEPVAAPAQPPLALRPDAPFAVGSGRTRYVGRLTGGGASGVHVFVLRYNRIGDFVDAAHALIPRVSSGVAARYELELPTYPYVSEERLAYSVG